MFCSFIALQSKKLLPHTLRDRSEFTLLNYRQVFLGNIFLRFVKIDFRSGLERKPVFGVDSRCLRACSYFSSFHLCFAPFFSLIFTLYLLVFFYHLPLFQSTLLRASLKKSDRQACTCTCTHSGDLGWQWQTAFEEGMVLAFHFLEAVFNRAPLLGGLHLYSL